MYRLLLPVLFIWSSCNNYIIIERSENFVDMEGSDYKFICIDPNTKVFDKQDELDIPATEKLNEYLKKEILASARRNKINIRVLSLDDQSDEGYYNNLLPLKKELILANNYQNTPLNFDLRADNNVIQKKVFVYPPLISHEFVSLSQKFGTSYFSYIGLYCKNRDILFYHLIVNTETAETVYRELKKVGGNAKNRKIIAQMVHDSIAMLKKEIE